MKTTLSVSTLLTFAFALGTLSLMSNCSSGPEVRAQKYAQLRSEKTFEHDFSTVWKAIERTFANMKIVERDPEEVDEVELRQLKERTLQTDWVNTESKEKYHSYKVNGLPRKKYLQMRYRFNLEAKTVIGGVHVSMGMDEEVELLDDNGQSKGWEKVDKIDKKKPSDYLDRIGASILSAPNT